MQIPILSGVYTSQDSDYRVSYPKNLVPVVQDTGISSGYLRPADGFVNFPNVTPPGLDRGGINYNGICFKVMGARFVSVSEFGIITDHGVVPGVDPVKMDYSFTHLGIASDKKFYLWDGGAVTQVTDPDLGDVIDFIFVDGYFLTTDGSNVVTTELGDPFSVLPFKFGSSEVDPDPVLAILKLRNEPHILNRHTIEVMENIGGTNFPFAVIDGAQITKGVVGTHACCVYLDNIAFLGGGRNEGISVWLGSGGRTVKISSREVDLLLENYTDAELADSYLEARVDKDYRQLFLHLKDMTLVYDGGASTALEQPVWFILSSSQNFQGTEALQGRYFVRCYNKWILGNPYALNIGFLSSDVHSHWDQDVSWEFSTTFIYNEARGAQVHELELIALTGRNLPGTESFIYTDYSLDGMEHSQPKSINAWQTGQRKKKLVWIGQGAMETVRSQRFYGHSSSNLSFSRLEARLEALAY